jgi:hypothetical protein
MHVIPTPVKEKVAEALGKCMTHAQIAQQIGVPQIAVTRHLLCTQQPGCTARHTPELQNALAKALGLSVDALFGPHAWYKLAAAKLEERRRAIEERRSA